MLGHHDKAQGTAATRTRSKKMDVTATVEARDLFREAFSPRRYGKLDNVFYEAVRLIAPRVRKQFTQRRARSIYEGTARRIDSEEMDALREAQWEQARREQQELRATLAALDEKIAALDAAVARKAMAEDRPRSRRMG